MKIFILAAFLVLTACGKSNDNNGGGGTNGPAAGGGGSVLNPQAVPDSICYPGANGAPVMAASSLYSTWHANLVGGNMTLRLRLAIAANSVNVTNDCDNGLSASVWSPATISANRIEILRTERNNVTGASGQSCEAGVTATWMTYTFEGRCLLMRAPGQPDTRWSPRPY